MSDQKSETREVAWRCKICDVARDLPDMIAHVRATRHNSFEPLLLVNGQRSMGRPTFYADGRIDLDRMI